MGKLIYRKPPDPKPHRHDAPNHDPNIKKGDVWECSCTQRLICDGRDYGVSQVQFKLIWCALWPEDAEKIVPNV
jgi:hypothetical protein